jgi:hypothetical protein
MKSPLAACLDNLSLTTTDAALAAGCPPQSVSAAKSGQPIPLALRVFLSQEAGIDVGALEAAHTKWRADKGAEIRSRVMSGRGGEIPASNKQALAGATK